MLSGVGVDDITGGQITGSTIVQVMARRQLVCLFVLILQPKVLTLMATVQGQSASMIISDTSVGSSNTGTTITNNVTNNITNTTNINNTTTINNITNIDNSVNVWDNRVWVNNDIKVFNANITNDSSVTTANIGNTTVFEGGDTNNVIVGSDAVDRLLGLAGDDYFLASAGDDTYNGGEGQDAVTFSQSKDNYSINKLGDDFIVTDTSGSEGANTLTDMERVGFSDGILALDVDAGETAGQGVSVVSGSVCENA